MPNCVIKVLHTFFSPSVAEEKQAYAEKAKAADEQRQKAFVLPAVQRAFCEPRSGALVKSAASSTRTVSAVEVTELSDKDEPSFAPCL